MVVALAEVPLFEVGLRLGHTQNILQPHYELQHWELQVQQLQQLDTFHHIVLATEHTESATAATAARSHLVMLRPGHRWMPQLHWHQNIVDDNLLLQLVQFGQCSSNWQMKRHETATAGSNDSPS